LRLHPASQEDKVIHAMEGWSPSDIRSLNNMQWTVLTPSFDRNKLHTNVTLPDKTIFPFEYDGVDNPKRLFGVHGAVWNVRIHPAHHNFANHISNVRFRFFLSTCQY
jgi:hypothetical protein